MMHHTVLTAALALATAAHAGPLAPPPGTPTSTGKTLEQVEPRFALDGTPGTFISTPGSYYLTQDINTTETALFISSPGVTLDLNGFAIIGDGTGLASDTGIFIQPDAVGTITIRNGAIRNFRNDGIELTFGELATLVLEGLHISDCFNGVDSVGPVIALRCTFANNDQDGLRLDGGVVDQCRAAGNGRFGFTGSDAAFIDSIATANSSTGFVAGSASRFTRCIANFNNGNGFVGGNGCVFTACTARRNVLNGFNPGIGSRVVDCVAYQNDVDGFALGSDSSISGCTADENGATGIRSNSDCRVDGNLTTDNDIGIFGQTGSLIIRNASAGNSINDYEILIGARAGPVVADPSGTTNPWANFDF